MAILKSIYKAVAPVAGAADAVKDWVEPKVGLNPAQRGSSGEAAKAANTPNGYWDFRRQPVANDPYVGDGGAGASGGGGGGGSSAPAYNADDLAYLNDQEGQLRRLLDNAQKTLGTGLTNLGDTYNREVGSANTQRSRALENFGIQREDTTRAKQGALTNVDTNARILNDSLRRILGMASGSGSSAYQLAAPNAVAREASGKRNSVLENYAGNDRNITLAEDRAKVDFQSLLEDLDRQRRDREQELRSGVLEKEQGIHQNLAGVAAERAKLLGGGYGDVRLATQPYQDAINSRQSQIDSLFSQFRSPVLTPKAVNVQTPELKDYLVDKSAINANQTQGPADYSPYEQFLRKKTEETI